MVKCSPGLNAAVHNDKITKTVLVLLRTLTEGGSYVSWRFGLKKEDFNSVH